MANTSNTMTMPTYHNQPPISPKLEALTSFWSPPGVYQVKPNVWSAVGFGPANIIMIKGIDGLIIDTGIGYGQGKKVMQEFRNLVPDLPVKAIIYTHGHVDHVQGAGAFVEQGENVAVYAHESTLAFYVNENALLGPIQSLRAVYATGVLLPKEGPDRQFMGILPTLPDRGNISFIPPTTTFSDQMDVDVSGVKLKLIHVRGETTDHINLWYPKEKVLFIGDNVYGVLPNIYSIRGVRFRDPLDQINALDTALSFHPNFVVGSHQKPIMDSAEVIDILTSVRDALEYIRDQTIRGMNKGYTADELAQMITLPKHLAEHPWLTQGRGPVAWFVKEIYNGYVGWYEGDPAFLDAISLVERSKHIVDGFGGINHTVLKVREAIENGKDQWASELATYVIKVDPQNIEAKLLKAHALRVVGQRMTAADGRQWYLTAALELEGKIKIDPNKFAVTSPQQLAALPIDNLLEILATKIDPVKAEGASMTLAISISDIGKNYLLHVRNGVLAVRKDTIPENFDMLLTLDLDAFKSIVNGIQTIVDFVRTGRAKFEGNIKDLEKFVAIFDPLLD